MLYPLIKGKTFSPPSPFPHAPSEATSASPNSKPPMWVLLYGMTWWCLLAPAHHGCLPLLNYYMKPLNWCRELTLIHLKQVRCTPEKYCQLTVQVSPPTACSWGCGLPHLSLVLGLTFLNYKDLRKKKFPLNLVFSSDSILPGQVSLNQVRFKVESPKWSNLMDCFN